MHQKHPIVILLLLACLHLGAQEGIVFSEGSWQEILARARAEGKPVFVDAYTTWCGPCKMMARTVFTERAVGDLYNERFVNAKIDMEKGEGIALAERYRVEAFPTLLFVDADGQVLHRAIGFHNVPRFLELGQTALDPARRLSSFEQRYRSGERGPAFLHDYAMVSFQAMNDNQHALAEEYLGTQDDWSTPKNMRFIFTFVRRTDSRLFDYLADHRPAFEEMFGSQAVISRIQGLIMEEAFAGNAGPAALDRVDALFARVYPEVGGQLSALFRMNYHQYTGDLDNYARATVHYLSRYASGDPAELNNAAWNFFEMVKDKKMLNEAVKWAEKSVRLDAQYYNYDTLAALYAKVGKRKKAILAAERAIALAKADGQDFSTTQQLLDQLMTQ